MSFKLGNTNIGELYVGSNKIAKAYLGSTLVYQSAAPVDPYNPLGLPPNTVRVRTSDGNPPTKVSSTSYETATLVTGTIDIYDVYKSGTNFRSLLYDSNNVIEVLGANTTGVTSMYGMFAYCSALQSVSLFNTSKVTTMREMFAFCKALQSVPLFDTSNVTNMKSMFTSCSNLATVLLFDTSKVTDMDSMFSSCTTLQSVPLFNTSNVTVMYGMFSGCKELQSVPLFDTSKVTDMGSTFRQCYKVQSGALALYQQASTQANPPTSHGSTFRYCGRDTTTGAAELAQIPSDWK